MWGSVLMIKSMWRAGAAAEEAADRAEGVDHRAEERPEPRHAPGSPGCPGGPSL